MGTVPSYRTWVVGEIVTAAFMNTNIRDSGLFLIGVPLFRGRNTAGQSIANATYTAVNLDTEDVDSDNGHSTVTNPSRYIGLTTGWYLLSGGCGWAVNAAGQRGCEFAKNGTSLPGTDVMQPNATASFASSTTVRSSHVQLNGTTDYVELRGFQSSGGALSTATNSTDQPSVDVQWVRGN